MKRVRVGDEVRCIDSADAQNHLALGAVYTVSYVMECSNDIQYLALKNVNNSGWLSTRFELAEGYRPLSPSPGPIEAARKHRLVVLQNTGGCGCNDCDCGKLDKSSNS